MSSSSRLLFRTMVSDADNLPSIGETPGRKYLSIRFGGGRHDDIEPDKEGMVHPTSGGLSVTPSDYMKMKPHLLPRRLGNGSTGPDELSVFQLSESSVVDPLMLRDTSITHAQIEPAKSMAADMYMKLILNTRPLWLKVT